jgi:Zn finger protein HypA/HybF involved in hydrogenase expression
MVEELDEFEVVCAGCDNCFVVDDITEECPVCGSAKWTRTKGATELELDEFVDEDEFYDGVGFYDEFFEEEESLI